MISGPREMPLDILDPAKRKTMRERKLGGRGKRENFDLNLTLFGIYRNLKDGTEHIVIKISNVVNQGESRGATSPCQR